MDNVLLSLVIGIGSSLLATAIFILASECFRKVVLPWYVDRIYRGVRIDGEWEIKERDGREWKSEDLSMGFNLTQKGDVVTGIYTHKCNGEVDEYILKGVIRDMYFLATAVPRSNRHVDAVSLLLYVNNVNSKLVMTGGVLYQGDPGEVCSQMGLRFQWKRN